MTDGCAIWRRCAGCASARSPTARPGSWSGRPAPSPSPSRGSRSRSSTSRPAAIDAVLLDDIIVDRYAGRHAGLAVVGDVAEGRYAIALRPTDGELRRGARPRAGRAHRLGRLAGHPRPLAARQPPSGGARRMFKRRRRPPAWRLPRVAAGSRRTSCSLFLQGALVTLGISLARDGARGAARPVAGAGPHREPAVTPLRRRLRRDRARHAGAAAALRPLLRPRRRGVAGAVDRGDPRPGTQLRGVRGGDLPRRDPGRPDRAVGVGARARPARAARRCDRSCCRRRCGSRCPA